MKDKLSLLGDVVIERRNHHTGEVIDREILKNLIVNTGLERVAKLIGAVGGVDAFGYLAIGTGSTGDSVAVGDTALTAEVARESATIAYEASYKVKFEKTFEFSTGESYDITEAGIGDSASETGDTLLDRFVFSAKAVDLDTDLYVKITITVAKA